MDSYPSHESLVAFTCRTSIRPQYPTQRTVFSERLPPSYDADHPPPYFPVTPLEPWLSVLRQKGWERTDLCFFNEPDTKPWSEEYAELSAQLVEWVLHVDPNQQTREAAHDPFGWCGVTPRDILFIDASFPSAIANTALSLRPREHATQMNDNTRFSSALLTAIAETARLGKYQHRHEWRPIKYHVPVSSTDTTDSGPYHADWMLACLGWTLPAALGDLLLTQHDYTQLVKALFLIQVRRKWAVDARALLLNWKRNPIYRWRRARSGQVSLEVGRSGPRGIRLLSSSFSVGSLCTGFGSLLNLVSSTTVAR